MADVAISDRDDVAQAVDEALGLLDLEDLVRDRVVVVKPNDTWASPRDTTAVTQGDTLQAVLRYLKRLAPARLVVSGGAGAAETSDVFEWSGMMAAVRAEGAEFRDHNRPPFRTVSLDYGPQREVVVNEQLTSVDTLVSLAQLKVHDLATVTLSMKNIAMSFPAADYYGHPRLRRLHAHRFFDDIHAFIVGMVRRFPIHLAVVVGHPAMVGRGPVGGRAVETGLVIAGRDAVAVDAVGARVLGFQPSAVGHIARAADVGLGTSDTDRLRFRGRSLEEAASRFAQRVYGHEPPPAKP